MSKYCIGVNENDQPYLAHFGIKGQKWGVRRYQNSDGTLTTAGRMHYNAQKETFKKDLSKGYKMHKKTAETINDANTRITTNKRGTRVYSTKDAQNVNRAVGRELRAMKKAKKTFNKMLEDFGETTLSSIDPATFDIGNNMIRTYGILI